MLKQTLPDSALIDKVGSALVRTHFGLSHQRLHNWRNRGIPLAMRIAFAKLCAERGITPHADFFEKFEGMGKAA